MAVIRGGRMSNLASPPVHWPALTLVAVILYWTPVLLDPGHSMAVALLLCSYAALLGFAAVNLRLVGMAVVALGLGLNTVVILANVGMPVDPAAVVATGLAAPEELASLDLGPSRQWQSDGDPLAVLGDVVPVAPLGEVVSFGDLILAAGLANVAFRLLRPAGPRRSQHFGSRGHARGRHARARLSAAR